MRFTLPSVSCEIPSHDTGNLRVEKKVQSPFEPNVEFDYEIKFTDASGNQLRDDYCYTKYSADGTELMTDIIIHDGGEFTLKDGEYIIVKYLPVGTNYTINESDDDQFTEYYSINGNPKVEGKNVTGTITHTLKDESMESVLFINKHNVVIDTAVTLDILPYIILFAIVGTGVILTSCDKRRRTDD